MNGKISLYIVEDYLLTRTTYKHYFTQLEEFELLGDFETAEECIEAMQNNEADIILMDLGLPYMNGLEATKRIKEKFSKAKVIILTSHDHDDEIFASLATGANAFTLKDISFPNLTNVIKEVYKGAVWLDPKIANMVLSSVPKPSSTNFNNLYDKKSTLDVKLSEREITILKLIIEGKSNTEIAEVVMISPHTAKSHVCKILTKLSVSDRVQAAVKAVQYNLV